MKHHRKAPLTRQQILDCFRWHSERDGENFTLQRFTEATGINSGQVKKLFGSWADLRAELGLYHRARPVRRYSVEDLLRHYHTVVEKLGRFPSIQEFELHTRISPSTLYRRIGGTHKFQSAYRAWLARQKVPDSQGPNIQVDANPPRDIAWLRKRWFDLRVGFELRSSHFKGREPDACDFLVVLEHDWPACPVRIIELHQALPHGEPRPTALPEDRLPLFEPLR